MAKKIETVFDHNITEKEMEAILGSSSFTRERLCCFSQNSNYAMIYNLYLFRKDKEKAQIYADKMPNTSRKVYCICYHDIVD